MKVKNTKYSMELPVFILKIILIAVFLLGTSILEFIQAYNKIFLKRSLFPKKKLNNNSSVITGIIDLIVALAFLFIFIYLSIEFFIEISD
jgi:hypothetical protein